MRTAWLSLEAELEVLADTLEERARGYRAKYSFYPENAAYWQGRAEQAELDAQAIRKAVDERQPDEVCQHTSGTVQVGDLLEWECAECGAPDPSSADVRMGRNRSEP